MSPQRPSLSIPALYALACKTRSPMLVMPVGGRTPVDRFAGRPCPSLPPAPTALPTSHSVAQLLREVGIAAYPRMRDTKHPTPHGITHTNADELGWRFDVSCRAA